MNKNVLFPFFLFLLFWMNTKAQFMMPTILNSDTTKYTASFIAEWAGDTASIETVTIVGNHMFGRAIHLYPEPHLQQFDYYFKPDGSIKLMNFQFYDLLNSSIPLKTKSGFLPTRVLMTAKEKAVDFIIVDKTGEKQITHQTERIDFIGGWVPIIGQWQWLANQVVKGNADNNFVFSNAVIGDYDLWLKQTSDTTIVFDSEITKEIIFYLDDQQKIYQIDAMDSPWNYLVKRTPPIDIEDYCANFAKKEVIGDPSPHEKLTINLSDCNIEVDYGRPSKRGRKIFGELVTYDKVWRTGAGTPTTIMTTKDLNFNGTIIPKGTYNLFTIPTPNSWTLVFNNEPEAWGSAHRPEFDFAKTNMEVSKLNAPVEKFTIEIVPDKDGGILKMSWGQTTAATRFSVHEP